MKYLWDYLHLSRSISLLRVYLDIDTSRALTANSLMLVTEQWRANPARVSKVFASACGNALARCTRSCNSSRGWSDWALASNSYNSRRTSELPCDMEAEKRGVRLQVKLYAASHAYQLMVSGILWFADIVQCHAGPPQGASSTMWLMGELCVYWMVRQQHSVTLCFWSVSCLAISSPDATAKRRHVFWRVTLDSWSGHSSASW